MIEKISEIDNKKLIKLWNDPKESNAAICKALDCKWSLINIKVKRVKSVSEALTLQRSNGEQGGVIDGNAAVETKKVESTSAAVAAVKKTAANVKTVSKGSDEGKEIVNELDKNFAVFVGNETIEWSQDVSKMREQMFNIMRKLGKNKADIIRNGERINLQDIRPGDKILLEANIGGALEI